VTTQPNPDLNLGQAPRPAGPPPDLTLTAPAYGQSPAAPVATPNYGQVAPPPAPYVPTPYPQAPYAPNPYTQHGAGPALATWQKRALGAVVDWGPMVVLFVLATIFSWINLGFMTFLLGLVALAWGVYNIGFLGGSTGVTFGRRIAGTRLLKEDTMQPLGAGLGIGRFFAHVVDGAIFCVGFLFPLFTPKKQTIADMIVGSIVIDQTA